MSVERLPIDKPKFIRSKSPRPQPTSSAVQVNEESDNLELTDRTGKTSETSTQTVDLPPNSNVYRTRARIQFASVCFSMFLAGWNDGTTGPLLPRIQKVYHVCGPPHGLSNCMNGFVRLDSSSYRLSSPLLASWAFFFSRTELIHR